MILESGVKKKIGLILKHTFFSSFWLSSLSFRFFDLDGPLFLGAAHVYWFSLVVPNQNFVGCIRDVYIDYKHLDLTSYIKENGTFTGCDMRFNDNPCAHGECNQGR